MNLLGDMYLQCDKVPNYGSRINFNIRNMRILKVLGPLEKRKVSLKVLLFQRDTYSV